jgi:hypothetical protein
VRRRSNGPGFFDRILHTGLCERVERRVWFAGRTFDPFIRGKRLGRLFQSSSNTYTPTRYVYDGDKLTAEYDGSNGALLRRYVHADGSDTPLVVYEGSGTGSPNYLYAD